MNEDPESHIFYRSQAFHRCAPIAEQNLYVAYQILAAVISVPTTKQIVEKAFELAEAFNIYHDELMKHLKNG